MGEHKPHQAALSHLVTMSRRNRLMNKLTRSSQPPPLPPPPSPPPWVQGRNNVIAMSSGNHGSPSSSVTSVSTPITSGNTALSPAIQTSTFQRQAPATTQGLGPPSRSSIVWAKALEIANEKLGNHIIPPLDPTNLTSQPVGEDIGAVIERLQTLQKDEKKKRWWGEKSSTFLKIVESYSKAVTIAVQGTSPLGIFVWAGVWAIMRVCIQ